MPAKKTKKRKRKAVKPKGVTKRKKDRREKKEPREGTYYVTDFGCGGDCSRIRFTITHGRGLLSITPKPPAQDLKPATLDAKLAGRQWIFQFFQTIRQLNAIGDPVGVIMQMFIMGYGGDVVCKAYGENCECLPNREHMFELWTRIIVIPAPFVHNGKSYIANYELKLEFHVIHASCAMLV